MGSWSYILPGFYPIGLREAFEFGYGMSGKMARTPYSELLSKANKNTKKVLNILGEFTQFPTVVPRDKKGLRECANYLQREFESHGYEALQWGGDRPVVYAEKNVGVKKTLMCYHHYDVQTEGHMDLWKSSPWKLVVRDGRAFGRGAIDDKGPCVASLVSFDMLEKIHGELPLNVKFVVEGEEEWSSETLARFASKNKKLMKADGCVWEILTATPGSITEVFPGMKGDLSIRLTVSGTPTYPKFDAHSGYGGAIPSAAWRLVQAVNTLKDKDNNITIDGIKKLVRPPTKQDIDALKKYRGNIGKEIKDNYGFDRFIGDKTGQDLLKTIYLDPSLSINGLESGCQGDVHSTIVPAKAIAKLDFRLVPDMDGDKVCMLLREHFKKMGYGDINIFCEGYSAAKTPLKDPFVKLVHAAAKEVAAPAPTNLLPMMAGTGPAYLFEQHTPFCISSSFADMDKVYEHGPNENMPVSAIVNNMAFVATVAERLGGL